MRGCVLSLLLFVILFRLFCAFDERIKALFRILITRLRGNSVIIDRFAFVLHAGCGSLLA